jgi:hypothetical protein
MSTFTARQMMVAAAAGVRGDVFNAAMAADVDPGDVAALLAFQDALDTPRVQDPKA